MTFREALALVVVAATMRGGWHGMDRVSEALPGWQHLPINFAVSALCVALCAVWWRVLVGRLD